MFVIRQATVEQMKASAELLMRQHWAESSRDSRRFAFAPQWARYEALEAGGFLVCLAAFAGEQLVGYCVTLVSTHTHNVHVVAACSDAMFVAPAHRGRRLGRSLIEETEQVVRERGAQRLVWHAAPGSTLEGLLRVLGYEVFEVLYSKEL
jgi:GNAT superfamily N-acetyltransferase